MPSVYLPAHCFNYHQRTPWRALTNPINAKDLNFRAWWIDRPGNSKQQQHEKKKQLKTNKIKFHISRCRHLKDTHFGVSPRHFGAIIIVKSVWRARVFLSAMTRRARKGRPVRHWTIPVASAWNFCQSKMILIRLQFYWLLQCAVAAYQARKSHAMGCRNKLIYKLSI